MNAPAPAAPDAAELSRPLQTDEFAALMARLGPFEPRPRFAVAVSGGPDSLALCLLAADWARRRGGEVVGLIVDHGLRPESAGEAAQTASWLCARGIACEILRWSGPKPRTGIQAAARAARLDLLAEECRQGGILHLLLAHHLDDQAETVALRQARQSGPDGLAGMPAIRELPGLRLLRPLLDVPKARLLATLRARSQPWIEDPSNHDPTFARARLRDADLDPTALCVCARRHARGRGSMDGRCAAWLARHARIDPLGFVRLDWAAWLAVPSPLAERILQQILIAVSGRIYPPRLVRLARLTASLRRDGLGRGCTLGGCRILPDRRQLLICREAGAIRERLRMQPGQWLEWDRRVLLRIRGPAPTLTVAALGEEGWRCRRSLVQYGPDRKLPQAVAESLPAVWRDAQLLAVPDLGLRAAGLAEAVTIEVRCRPRQPLAGPPFAGANPAALPQAFASPCR